jgi:bacillithiol system protein YtxJ
MERMQRITEEQDVEKLFQADLAILYKHSPKCGISAVALKEVEAFLGERPDAGVWIVDVLAQRPLSQRIAERAGIAHESPQVILLQRGVPRWNESHYGITAAAIAEQFRLARG